MYVHGNIWGKLLSTKASAMEPTRDWQAPSSTGTSRGIFCSGLKEPVCPKQLYNYNIHDTREKLPSFERAESLTDGSTLEAFAVNYHAAQVNTGGRELNTGTDEGSRKAVGDPLSVQHIRGAPCFARWNVE